MVDTLGTSLVERALDVVKEELSQPSPVLAQHTDFGSTISPDRDRVTEDPPSGFPRRKKRARSATDESREPPQRRLRSDSNRPEEQSVGIVSRRQSKGVDAITNPTPGNVYLGYRPQSKSWLAVLLLPLGNFEEIGLKGTIADAGLLHNVPPCYRYSRKAKAFRGWQDGFEDGGPFTMNRQFPIIYFDDQFPKRCSTAWMSAKDLKLFDPENPSVYLIPNHGPALDFLKRRAVGRSSKVEQNEAMAPEIEGNQGPKQLQADSRIINSETRNSTPSEPARSCIIVWDSEPDSDEAVSSIDEPEGSQDPNQDGDENKDEDQEQNQEQNQSHEQAQYQNQDEELGRNEELDHDQEPYQDQVNEQNHVRTQEQRKPQNQDLALEAPTSALHHTAPNGNGAENYQNRICEATMLSSGPQFSTPDKNINPINQTQNSGLNVLSSHQHSSCANFRDSISTNSSHFQVPPEVPTMEHKPCASAVSTSPSEENTRNSDENFGSTVSGLLNTPKSTKAVPGALGLLEKPSATAPNAVNSSQSPVLSNGNQVAAGRTKQIEEVLPTGPAIENRPEMNQRGVHIPDLIREQNLKANLQQTRLPPMSAAPLPSGFKSQAAPPWLPSQNPNISGQVMQPLVGGLPSPVQSQVHMTLPQLAPGSQVGRRTSAPIFQQRASETGRFNSAQSACNLTLSGTEGHMVDPKPNLGLLSIPQTTHKALSAPNAIINHSPKPVDTNRVPSRWLSIRPSSDISKSNPDNSESVHDKQKPFLNVSNYSYCLSSEGPYICRFCKEGFDQFRSIEEHVEKSHPQEYLNDWVV
ncbi:hypothetical protein F5Y01DRAFT_184153 [Xylaria sp. FL0043]|nr:hypothetical protein F5Y01DRAFT_184153 [Xylaria sp. FL0043]